MESIDSISPPFWDAWFVVTDMSDGLRRDPLDNSKLPEKEKLCKKVLESY